MNSFELTAVSHAAAHVEDYLAQGRIIALRQAIDYRTASGGEELLMLTDREGRILAGTETSWPAEVAPQGSGFDLSTPQEITRDGTRWLVVARELPGGFGLLAVRLHLRIKIERLCRVGCHD